MPTQINERQIHVKNEGPVRIIDFSNPPMNFISSKMLLELYHELVSIKTDDSVRVLVLTGVSTAEQAADLPEGQRPTLIVGGPGDLGAALDRLAAV